MSSRIRLLILAFAAIGLALSATSSWVHYRLLTDPSYITPCDVSASLNCSQAYLSRFGSLFGVPVALGGVMWFALVGLIAAFARPGESRSSAAGYLFVLSTIGLAVSLYLAYASFFILGTGCLLCMGTYVCVIAIFVLTAMTDSAPLGSLPGRLGSDLKSVTATPAVLAATVLFLAGSVSLLAFFPREGAAPTPGVPVPAGANTAFAAAWAQQPRIDMGIPNDGAKVIIVKFNDFECPACRQGDVFYQPVLAKFAASHPGAVKVVVKDWPWNADCNFNTSSTIRGHEAACYAAAAARIGQDRGKREEMVAWLYANQGVARDAVREAAIRILGPLDFDKEYAAKLPDIRRDIADGGALNINSTPTYFINGVRLPTDGMMSPALFEQAISLEIARAPQ